MNERTTNQHCTGLSQVCSQQKDGNVTVEHRTLLKAPKQEVYYLTSNKINSTKCVKAGKDA